MSIGNEGAEPVAVWSGEIHGIKVHVLDDGRRIIDAEDMRRLFRDIANGEDGDFDPTTFAQDLGAFMNGSGLPNSVAQEPK